MSIIEDTKGKIAELERALGQFALIEDSLPFEVRLTTKGLLENQIREMKYRLEKLTFLRPDKKCTICDNWIRDYETPVHLFYQLNETSDPVNITFCSHCIGSVRKIMTTNEAEKTWNLPAGTIKQDRKLGNLKAFEDIGLLRYSGRYILVHEVVMKSYYEPKIKEREIRRDDRNPKKSRRTKRSTSYTKVGSRRN